MGIASSLIIVRVTLGIAVHDEQSLKETIRWRIEPTQLQRPASRSVIDIRRPQSLITPVDIQSRTTDSDFDAQKGV
ncbi:hypothetical protein PM082_024143 [Marasmius tenuissimus]|nr:hypothetical protein PM082_024143 [Marasmius tenuissimus]